MDTLEETIQEVKSSLDTRANLINILTDMLEMIIEHPELLENPVLITETKAMIEMSRSTFKKEERRKRRD